jgi:hypothetical protein
VRPRRPGTLTLVGSGKKWWRAPGILILGRVSTETVAGLRMEETWFTTWRLAPVLNPRVREEIRERRNSSYRWAKFCNGPKILQILIWTFDARQPKNINEQKIHSFSTHTTRCDATRRPPSPGHGTVTIPLPLESTCTRPSIQQSPTHPFIPDLFSSTFY